MVKIKCFHNARPQVRALVGGTKIPQTMQWPKKGTASPNPTASPSVRNSGGDGGSADVDC